MKIKVTDPNVKSLSILQMLEKLGQGDRDRLIEAGVRPESLDKLRSLHIGSLLRLVHLDFPEVHFRIAEESIATGLDTLQRQSEDYDDLAYFIQNGASQTMLNHLFRFSMDVIQHYRKFLAKDTKPGRTSMPNIRVREEIQLYWYSIDDGDFVVSSSLRKKLRLLHQKFSDYSSDTLYATINEFGDVLPKRKTS